MPMSVHILRYDAFFLKTALKNRFRISKHLNFFLAFVMEGILFHNNNVHSGSPSIETHPLRDQLEWIQQH